MSSLRSRDSRDKLIKLVQLPKLSFDVATRGQAWAANSPPTGSRASPRLAFPRERRRASAICIYAKFAISRTRLWRGPAIPPPGYESLRDNDASRVVLAVSQLASCLPLLCPVVWIEFVDPGAAEFPFLRFSPPRFAARSLRSLRASALSLSLYISSQHHPAFLHRSSRARTANNVRSSLGRAWQRANAA